MAENDLNLELITEIEKRDCLYNNNTPAYMRKDLTDKAWGEVSAATGISVHECKEKWRNIRSSFCRSLKITNGRAKKPYYLKHLLNFLLPYVKSHRNDSQVVDDEDIDEEAQGLISDDSHLDISRQTPEEALWIPLQEHRQNSRKRTYSEDFEAPQSKKSTQENQIIDMQQSLKYFFLSIIPDLGDMTDQQRRMFKIKTLELIDEINDSGQAGFNRTLVSTRAVKQELGGSGRITSE